MCESRKRKDKEEGQREGNEREEGAGDSDMRFDVFDVCDDYQDN